MKKLSSLLAALSTSALLTPLSHGADVDVVDVSTDSRLIQPGMIFVAIVGTNFDGHAAIGDAIARGASAIVVEHQPPSPLPVPVICVSDSRRAFAELVRVLFDHPSEPLAMYGVTGTNGKTTCATLLEQV